MMALQQLPDDPRNVRLLSILAYIGPLFIMGRVAVEKDNDEVAFHARQGQVLFISVAVAYLVTFLLCWALSSLPAAQEIIGLLLYVGISAAWFLMSVMGIIGAARKQKRPLPFIGDLDRFIKK